VPQTIFCVTRKIVPAARNIFLFEKDIVSGIETMVWVKNTIVAMSETIVTAAQKIGHTGQA